jgi:hypothetical protein
MKKTKIINLFGGPGVGKSTTAAGVFHRLQMMGFECDLPYEYPKISAWEKNLSELGDQLHILSSQHRNIVRSFGKVDYIILDSPILLSIIYKRIYTEGYPSIMYDDTFNEFTMGLFNRYNNINFFIRRDNDGYVTEGRLQNKSESLFIDNEIHTLLKDNNIEFFDITQEYNIANKIAEHIAIDTKVSYVEE